MSTGICYNVRINFHKALKQIFLQDNSLESILEPVGEPQLLVSKEETTHLDLTIIDVPKEDVPYKADSYVIGLPQHRKNNEEIRVFLPIQYYRIR